MFAIQFQVRGKRQVRRSKRLPPPLALLVAGPRQELCAGLSRAKDVEVVWHPHRLFNLFVNLGGSTSPFGGQSRVRFPLVEGCLVAIQELLAHGT